MKVYYDLNGYNKLKPLVLSIGSYDGVHLAHQSIIRKCNELATELGGESAILTFSPHPRITLNKDPESLRLLNSIDEKEKRLENSGLDNLFLMRFDSVFADQSAEEFIENILTDKMGVDTLVIGYDHRFGKDRSGDVELLKSYEEKGALRIELIEQQSIDTIVVSSTKIRNYLAAGELSSANALLGYPYTLSGTILKGDGIGRELGYPTANLRLMDPYKLIPADGVYAVNIDMDGIKMPGMGYIGKRPTLEGKEGRIEINIFNFNQDIYGKFIWVEMLHRTRGDMRFDNLDQLKAQIAQDEITVKGFFNI